MSRIQCLFDSASDYTEHLFSVWWGIVAYFVGMALSGYFWGWDGADRYIYVTGAFIIIVLIGAGRRDSKATHAKLDAVTPGHVLDRLEEKPEQEIEEARNG